MKERDGEHRMKSKQRVNQSKQTLRAAKKMYQRGVLQQPERLRDRRKRQARDETGPMERRQSAGNDHSKKKTATSIKYEVTAIQHKQVSTKKHQSKKEMDGTIKEKGKIAKRVEKRETKINQSKPTHQSTFVIHHRL